MEIRITESFITYAVKDSINIDPSFYPELDGMTEDQIKAHIEENGWEMAAPEGYEFYSSLMDALQDQEIVRDKISGEETEIEIE
jgi:hypothetical protein